MPSRKHYAQLLYQYEIVLAKLSVREHFLKTVVREVYENIGQVLSLIRVQLATVQTGFVNGAREQVLTSGELVGQTIRELRSMCRFFFPEENILGDKGFTGSLCTELKAIFPEASCDTGAADAALTVMDSGRSVLLYSILLEIFRLIETKGNGKLVSLHMTQVKEEIQVYMVYNGELIWRKNNRRQPPVAQLSPFERLLLFNGKTAIKKTGTDARTIKLAFPIHQTT